MKAVGTTTTASSKACKPVEEPYSRTDPDCAIHGLYPRTIIQQNARPPHPLDVRPCARGRSAAPPVKHLCATNAPTNTPEASMPDPLADVMPLRWIHLGLPHLSCHP